MRLRSRLYLLGGVVAFAATWVVAWVWGYENMISPLVDWIWPR